VVRIVGGRARGTHLGVPKGLEVRPTSDRVRESLFNILSHRFEHACENARVLDLFAGSGALGLEALSRNAKHVCFVEKNQQIAKLVKMNATKLQGDWQVVHASAESFLKRESEPYDLIFLDPPYSAGLLAPTLAQIVNRAWLSTEGLLCIEYPVDNDFEVPDNLHSLFERRYGKTIIRILAQA
jgi:16S rRNA (guanine966-N2)-methyltransferase